MLYINMSQLVWFVRAGKRFVVSHVGRHKDWMHNLQKFSTIEIFWQTHIHILAHTQTHWHRVMYGENHRQARAVAQEQLEMKRTTRDAREGVLLFFLQLLLLLSLHMHMPTCVCECVFTLPKCFIGFCFTSF